MDIIDIGISDLDDNSFRFDLPSENPPSSSVSFGSGIELLMNNSRKNHSANREIHLGNLDDLEKEPTTTQSTGGGGGSSGGGWFNMFSGGGGGGGGNDDNDDQTNTSNIGRSTAETIGINTPKTWDGFSKMNDAGPQQQQPSASSRMSEREKRAKKRLMIKQMEKWHKDGMINYTSHFDTDSPYDEIEDEFESFKEEKRKRDSIKLQGWWLTTVVSSMEYGNAFFNPFDINLDGWGEQVTEELNSYDDVFEELYEKYKGGKLAPELNLIMKLVTSGVLISFTNKALSSATPGFNDVIRQSPELMKAFASATADTMNQTHPGFGFMNNLMSGGGMGGMGGGPNNTTTRDDPPISMSYGRPPQSVETKNQPRSQERQGNNSASFSSSTSSSANSRPDLNRGMIGGGGEKGITINQNYESINAPTTIRQEMKGPADIDNLLSGLKRAPPAQQQQQQSIPAYEMLAQQQQQELNQDSLISVEDMNAMKNASLPTKTNRRKKNSRMNISNEGETITLDI